jgi:ribonuclease HII
MYEGPMFVVGVDENGLGPLLGALISTAVTVEVPAYDAASLRALGLASGLTDSKKSGGFGRMARCESVALALAESLAGRRIADVDVFLGAISEVGVVSLRAPCPERAGPQCWSEPLALPAYGGSAVEGHALLAGLVEAGVAVRRVRSAIACAGVLNAQLDRGVNKLAVNLAAFERLILDGRARAGEDLLAVCGMIGGIRKYDAHFRHFVLARAEEQGGGVSAWRVPGVGAVRFVVDADDGHLPVALASMVGKYVREVTMERVVRFYRARVPGLPAASGYHDPVTRRFVAGTAGERVALGIVDDCFARRG